MSVVCSLSPSHRDPGNYDFFGVCGYMCVFRFFFFYLLEKERGRAGRRAERQGQVDSLLSGSREITGLYPRTSRS